MKYLTQKELAQRWRVSQSTIINWREKGEIPYFRVPYSSRILYPEEQIEALEKTNTTNQKEEKKGNTISRTWRI